MKSNEQTPLIAGKFGTRKHMLNVIDLCYYYMNGMFYNPNVRRIENSHLTASAKKELEDNIGKYWLAKVNKKL